MESETPVDWIWKVAEHMWEEANDEVSSASATIPSEDVTTKGGVCQDLDEQSAWEHLVMWLKCWEANRVLLGLNISNGCRKRLLVVPILVRPQMEAPSTRNNFASMSSMPSWPN